MKKNILMFFVCLFALPLWAGNSIGNGGNSIAEDPVAATAIQDILKDARRTVFLYISYQNMYGCNLQWCKTPEIKNLFYGNTSIFNVIKNVKIETPMSGPCKDENGQDSDGSSIGSTSDTICISPFRLQNKLNKDNFIPQTLALVLHELSHRVGYSEDQAIAIQKIAIKNFRAQPTQKQYYTDTEFQLKLLTEQMNKLKGGLSSYEDLIPVFETIDSQQLYWAVSSIYHAFGQSEFDFRNFNGNMYSAEEGFALQAITTKLGSAWNTKYVWDKYPCFFLSAECNKSLLEYNNYLIPFKGQDVISASQYSQNSSSMGWGKQFPPDIMMRRISSRSDLKAELSEVIPYLKSSIERHQMLLDMND